MKPYFFIFVKSAILLPMANLIFFGSDQYSAIVLTSLLKSSVYRLTSVVTDQRHDPTPVEKLAITHNLKVAYYPDFDHSLITKDTLGLCASFDHLLPAEIVKLFKGRLYNLHPSLLPQYRNVSPVQYANSLGDKETGITLFRISPGIDDGEIIAQVACSSSRRTPPPPSPPRLSPSAPTCSAIPKV
jgi:methionyl-tRNA formyltransferase